MEPITHTIEPASSGRAKCRGCGNTIAKGELRFGERLPNPFSEGKLMTHWFHLRCAALKRPAVILETLDAAEDAGDRGESAFPDKGEVDKLVSWARVGDAHRRVPRIDGAERATSARARCRHCRETIDKDAWRIRLVYYDEGQFNPSGYIHASCAPEYLEFDNPAEIAERAAHFAPELDVADLSALSAAIQDK